MGDSTEATRKHQERVKDLLRGVVEILMDFARGHDRSKLSPEEKPGFDAADGLWNMEYNSPEYKAALERLGPSLKHHYELNRHHPEHWPNGIYDMDLLDLLEMLCDWKAAGERHATGSIKASIEKNTERFELDPHLVKLFTATAERLGWL